MLAPWNFNCQATRMALGFLASHSGENLFLEGKSIPPGFTPCNAKHISLGFSNHSKKILKSSTGPVLVELFLWLFFRMTLSVKQ